MLEERAEGFETVIVRPATVCGYAPHVRLDLCVHILTMSALRNKIIQVFGGDQFRPNIHIQDLTDAYLLLLKADKSKVDGEIFNVGHTNMTIMQTAQTIRDLIWEKYKSKIEIEVTSSNDNRSYHVSSDKIKNILGFKPQYSIESAIDGIIGAYKGGLIANPDDNKYYAIRRMKTVLSVDESGNTI